MLTLLLAAALAAATAVLGWWAVPALVALWAIVARLRGRPLRPLHAALAGALAWAALLVGDAVGGNLGATTATYAGAMGLPAAALVLATVLLPTLLAWSTAALVGGGMAARPAAIPATTGGMRAGQVATMGD
jgi:hypothetical protein